ncbi:MAG: hypothetical protein AAGE52_32665 [Myxococcota bacterium]
MGLRTLLLVCLACGGTPLETRSPEAPETVAAETPSELVPAGRWFLGSPSASGCVDCPTPRFAVLVNDEASLELGAGYPLRMFRHELGIGPLSRDLDDTVQVAAMFATREEAESWRAGKAPEGTVVQIHRRRASASVQVVHVLRTSPGFDSEAIRAASGNTEDLSPTCSVRAGAYVVEDEGYSEGDIIRIPDAAPWVRLPCGGGQVAVAVRDTDFGRIVDARVPEVIETQYAGGVCGSTYYKQRVGDGEERTLETERCFGQPSQDTWGVCEGGTLDGCADRAEALLRDGRDLFRAARVAAYACSMGLPRACILRWTIDFDRGRPVAEVLADATSSCHEDAAPELCAEVNRLLRTISPERLSTAPEPALGVVSQAGCAREIPGWCELLETSTLCDEDGCG